MSRLLFLGAIVLAASALVRAHVEAAEPTVTTGIDVDTTGNTATALGQPDACREVAPGQGFDVDVYVTGVPVASGGAGGLIGFSYNLLFDPAVVQVTAVDDNFLIAAGGEASPYEVIDGDGTAGGNSDPLPGTTGNVRIDYLDLSSSVESGSGVLSRVTLRALGPGRSDLQITDQIENADAPTIVSSAAESTSGSGGTYPIASVQNALITVGEPCQAPPTPLVPDQRSSTTSPPGSGQSTTTPSSIETASRPGQPSTSADSSAHAEGEKTGGTTPAAGTDSGGGFPWWIVGVVGVAFGGAAAYVYYRTRRSPDAGPTP